MAAVALEILTQFGPNANAKQIEVIFLSTSEKKRNPFVCSSLKRHSLHLHTAPSVFKFTSLSLYRQDGSKLLWSTLKRKDLALKHYSNMIDVLLVLVQRRVISMHVALEKLRALISSTAYVA